MKTNTKRKNAEAVRLGEIVSMKKKNRRVYRMSDGTLQAVYRFSAPQDAVDEIDEVPVEEADGKHYRQRRPHFTARFSRDEENDELILVESLRFNLDELVTEDILLGLPTRHLCKEDCKGVCQYCGKNLNEDSCNCSAPLDPRLAALQQLLDNNDE